MVIDALSAAEGIPVVSSQNKALVGKGKIAGKTVRTCSASDSTRDPASRQRHPRAAGHPGQAADVHERQRRGHRAWRSLSRCFASSCRQRSVSATFPLSCAALGSRACALPGAAHALLQGCADEPPRHLR